MLPCENVVASFARAEEVVRRRSPRERMGQALTPCLSSLSNIYSDALGSRSAEKLISHLWPLIINSIETSAECEVNPQLYDPHLSESSEYTRNSALICVLKCKRSYRCCYVFRVANNAASRCLSLFF